MLEVATKPEETTSKEFFTPFLPAVREFFDLFEWPENVFAWPKLGSTTYKTQLRIEQFTEGGYLVVRAEVPGVNPEKDVQVTFTEGGVYITAERRQTVKEQYPAGYFSEWRYGTMYRYVPLPKGVTEKEVKATYFNGILELRILLPKEPVGAITIPIAH